MILDSETKAVELPEDHGNELRLWLRLLTCTTLIEGEVRSRLRERFNVTLPRFDLMAQLDKILNLEREIKRTHIALVIRIKNRLSAEQQTRLQELKRKPAAR